MKIAQRIWIVAATTTFSLASGSAWAKAKKSKKPAGAPAAALAPASSDERVLLFEADLAKAQPTVLNARPGAVPDAPLILASFATAAAPKDGAPAGAPGEHPDADDSDVKVTEQATIVDQATASHDGSDAAGATAKKKKKKQKSDEKAARDE